MQRVPVSRTVPFLVLVYVIVHTLQGDASILSKISNGLEGKYNGQDANGNEMQCGPVAISATAQHDPAPE